MTIDSPILGCLALLVAAAAVYTSAKAQSAARWLFRAGTVAACGAVAGVHLRCDRPLNIAVIVDVSPSTRGAAFRDARSVQARLTPLLAGRPYTLHYFADGEQPAATEPPAERTRLDVPADADAIILMSDGRFELPAALPPTYVLIDPALNAPADARVRGVAPTSDGMVADVVAAGGRSLIVENEGGPQTIFQPPVGPNAISIPQETLDPAGSSIRFVAGDAWPENDGLHVAPRRSPVRREAVDFDLPGFESRSSAVAANSAAGYLDTSVLVLPTTAASSPTVGALTASQISTALGAVHELGLTLVLVGPAGEGPPALRAASPVSALPPVGPQLWCVLLDASGSMAASDGDASRWMHATAAAASAIERLPTSARVSVFRFADEVRTIIADGTPADAIRAIAVTTSDGPSGKTGLLAALETLASRSAEIAPIHVLLLTDGDADLGDTGALADALNRGRVTVDAVAATPAAALSALCAATGGRAVTGVAASAWSTAIGGLAGAARPVIEQAENWPGRDALAGLSLTTSRRWPASIKGGATTLAGDEGTPVVAAWNVGLGRVVAVPADLPAADLAAIATRLERPASDPRFAAMFDDRAGVVKLTAVDAGRPMNGLSPALHRDGRETGFETVGPGEYSAVLRRDPHATVAVVTVGGAVVARAALAGRYAVEFDDVGNDRNALTTLASSSGGAVIEAGDNREISLPRRLSDRPLQPLLTPLSAVLMLAGVAATLRGRIS